MEYTSTETPCTHATGWYGTVKFGIFTKEVFFCSDCKEFIYGKELNKTNDYWAKQGVWHWRI